eukprot:scaffold153397_cov37-Prasinocladus_malaysianus.AAC.2
MATIRTKWRCFVRLQTQLYEYNYNSTRSSTAACNRTRVLHARTNNINHHQHDHPTQDAVVQQACLIDEPSAEQKLDFTCRAS